MSENNQKPPAQNPEKRENNGERNGNRRGRHRPHHKNGNKQRSPEKELEARNESNAAESAPESRNEKKKQQPHGERKKNGNQNNRNQNRNGGQNKGRQFNRRDRESRMYDPYEAPSKQEIELSELRAQIVLQAADGSHPEAYGTAPSPAEAKTVIADISEQVEPNTAPLTPAPVPPSPVTKSTKQVEVVGVRFRSSGKMYYFDPHGLRVKKGQSVIVETTRGPEFGDVCLGNSMVSASDTVTPLRPVLRVATPDDIARNADNRKKEQEALPICREKILAHGLEMKLIDVQYAFDGSKILFYFSAEGRVDFRELVKDLASVFRTRIELRQIGIRDEAKMLGGIGACGRSLCCATFLPDFAQVSIKMAKDQSLSLNSAKISGVCGRLMCCLRYEEDVYVEEIRKTPSNDTLVRTEDGVGVVIGSNPLAGTIRVVLKDSQDTAPKQYHRDSVTVLGKNHKGSADDKKGAEK